MTPICMVTSVITVANQHLFREIVDVYSRYSGLFGHLGALLFKTKYQNNVSVVPMSDWSLCFYAAPSEHLS